MAREIRKKKPVLRYSLKFRKDRQIIVKLPKVISMVEKVYILCDLQKALFSIGEYNLGVSDARNA